MTTGTAPAPDGWRVVRLGEVARVIAGQSPPGDTVVDWDGEDADEGLPFIQGNAEFGARFPSPVKWCGAPAKRAEPGDSLLSVRAPVGETNRVDTALGIGRGVAAIRFQHLDPEFGWHALNRAKWAFERLAQGSTFTAINARDVRELAILTPQLPEQRRIAAVLDAIDEAIGRSEAVVAATEGLRRSLLHELLSEGLPGRHSAWREVAGVGRVPSGWEVVRLGEVAEVVGGSTPSRQRADYWKGDIPWVAPSELAALGGRHLDGSRESITEEGRTAAGLRVLPVGSVLLTSRATIGATAINAVPVTTNQGFQNLIPGVKVDGLWLFYRVSAMSNELQRRAAGSTFREISRDSVRSLPIPLPPLPEQRRIAAVLDGVDRSLEAARQGTDVLRSLKASASEALLSGRVRVTKHLRTRTVSRRDDMANRKREPQDPDRDGRNEERLVGRDRRGRYDDRPRPLAPKPPRKRTTKR